MAPAHRRGARLGSKEYSIAHFFTRHSTLSSSGSTRDVIETDTILTIPT